MINVGVTISGDKQLKASLEKLAKGLSNFRPLFERIGQEFYQIETRRFNSAPWAPLSPKYAEQKAKKFPGKPILRATDKLYNSYTRQGAEGNIHKVGALEAEFGSSDPKGPFHQFGTARMPARPPMELTDRDYKRFDVLAQQHMSKLLREAGFI